MSLAGALQLGPINLPVRYLVFIVAAAVGYLVMRLALRKNGNLRRSSGNRFLNALVLFVVVWKLEPVGAALATGIAGGRVALQAVLLQLFVPGGRLAAAAGAAVAVIYLVVSILRTDGRPGALWRPFQSDRARNRARSRARTSAPLTPTSSTPGC